MVNEVCLVYRNNLRKIVAQNNKKLLYLSNLWIIHTFT